MNPFPACEKGLAVIMTGIPGSGKSTFVRQFFPFAERINLDTLHTRARERALLLSCIERSGSFAVDNTNPTKADRAPYIRAAKDAGYQVIGCYMQSAVAACVRRNSQRTGKDRVPEHVIAHISRILELPEYSEGFDRLYYVQIKDGQFTIEDWREENEI